MSRHESEGLGVGEYTYSKETTAELVTSLRSGDLSVIPQLVEAYVPLVRSMAIKFARYNVSDREELYTLGLEVVFHVLQKAPEKLVDDNLTYYLVGCLRKYMLRGAWQLRNPVGSWDSASRKGRKNWSINQCALDADVHLAKDESSLIALRSVIYSLAQNSVEREIISRLADGETGIEIADSMNLSATAVSRIRTILHQRYMRYERDLADDELPKFSAPPSAPPETLPQPEKINESVKPQPTSITGRTLHGDGTPASSHDAYFSEFCN